MLGGGAGGAAGEGAATARKFGDDGHGGIALVRPERERERVRRDGEGRGSPGALLWRRRAFSSAWHEVGRASAMAGRAPVHGCHDGISSNTWRAPELTWWGANLGHFRAESVLGPKMKFAHLGLLYVSHLRCLII